MVIDRLTNIPTIVRWIDPGHLLALADDKAFSIRSISARQGRGLVFEQRFATPTTTLILDTENKRIVTQTAQNPQTLEELGW